MIVRWKPLLVLSGLFLVIAVVGVLAMAFTLVPKGSGDILPSARTERTAGQYEKALIHYKRALQVDPKNAAIHEELAAMFGEWLGKADRERRNEIQNWRLGSLAEAAKYGKALKEPRRSLLLAAMEGDEVSESLRWAKEVIALEPGDPDAHYVMAQLALDARPSAVPDVRRHLAFLEEAKAPAVRVALVKARLAQATGDAATRETILVVARSLSLPKGSSPVDEAALLRLRALDVETTTDVATLSGRVAALQTEIRTVVTANSFVPNRIMRLSYDLERVQFTLGIAASNQTDPASKKAVTELNDGIEKDLDVIFRRSLSAARKANLDVFYKYAEHLKFRNERDRCLEVVNDALSTPLANTPASTNIVMGLHEVAVLAALSNPADQSRYDKAAPHIKALLASSSSKYQGYGYLFQGAIEMEQAGLAVGSAGANADGNKRLRDDQIKTRSNALNHLKLAATQLPDVVEAQARYGVALILSQEQSLGRQYLQNAIRLGTTEPQHQIWAAWSMVQAGYPEEAEPIVNHLVSELNHGRISRDLEVTLHLLSGEIHQVKQSPNDLKMALAEFERSYTGKTAPTPVQIRMAQIEVQIGHPELALKRVETLRANGQGGTSTEYLAVLTLLELGKKSEALATLAKARATFSESEDLVSLEANLLLRDKKLVEADRVLADFVERNPENYNVVMIRSQVLADLNKLKEARQLLVNVAERTDNSGPLVQLALLDMKRKDYEAVHATIARVRGRWKEAAAADLLAAQLALEQGNSADAIASFDAALKKDPGNKVVQFWKAQIESQSGSTTDAVRAFESIARQGSSKEMDTGLSITAAAQSALANLAFQNGDVDAAIRRFEVLRAGGALGGLTRADRWQLVAAYSVKGQWPAAKTEVKRLLDDPKDAPSTDERVRAANFYRQSKDEAAAIAQLDYVLANNAAHPAAVVTRAYMLAESKKPTEAAALIRKAIEASAAAKDREASPAVFYLMLAAVENRLPPLADAGKRALLVLDQGLAARPKALELVQAKYRLLLGGQGAKAARAFVETEAKGDTDGSLTRVLADVYRDQGELENAETVLETLVAKYPKDVKLAAALVQVVATRAAKASDRSERKAEQTLMGKVDRLIRDGRSNFPNEVVFLQEECEQAFRKGDIPHATSVTKEIDQLSKNSPTGPLLRARIYAAQGNTAEVAEAYADALERNPRQPNVRLLLGQSELKLGKTDDALRQAKLVLDADPTRSDALLLAARALAQPAADPARSAAGQAKALETLNMAIKTNPKFSAAYHQIAEVQLRQGKLDLALATLRSGLSAVPDDALGIAQVVELLAQPLKGAASPTDAKLAEADALAESVARQDERGGPTLALAVGFHKAGQLGRAKNWAEKASAKLDTPVVHMNYGDILLTLAERSTDDAQAKGYFEKAVEQYDLVLKTQANSIEAINNKAWIIHSHFHEDKKALLLANGLLTRVDPSILPGEFFDTLGAIQESLGNTRGAEDSYAKGLRKSPNHPVLNYHMAKLIASDTQRSAKAQGFLEKANAQKDKLTPSMAADVALLMGRAAR